MARRGHNVALARPRPTRDAMDGRRCLCQHLPNCTWRQPHIQIPSRSLRHFVVSRALLCPIVRSFTPRSSSSLTKPSSAGVLGPIVFHGPIQDGAEYDIDLGPVMVMEWYHDSYEHIVTEVETGGVTSPATAFRPHADSNLVQGKGFFP